MSADSFDRQSAAKVALEAFRTRKVVWNASKLASLVELLQESQLSLAKRDRLAPVGVLP